MTEQSLLRGVIGDLEGSEGHLLFAQPVVEIGGREYVGRYQGDDILGESSFTLLRDSQREFVRWLRPAFDVPINPGDGVWVAGRNLVQDAQALSRLRDTTRELLRWNVMSFGFRWTTGSHVRFTAFRTSAANALERELHNQLFDPLEKSHGDVEQVFRLYNAFATEDTLARALNRGLFYDETRDVYRLELTRHDAIKAGHVRAGWSFDFKLERLRRQLRRPRLSENARTPQAARAWEPRERYAELLYRGLGSGPSASRVAWSVVDGAVAWRPTRLEVPDELEAAFRIHQLIALYELEAASRVPSEISQLWLLTRHGLTVPGLPELLGSSDAASRSEEATR